jgi:hypothetical protein
VAAQPARLLVVERGRVSVEHERRTRHRWRQAVEGAPGRRGPRGTLRGVVSEATA